MKNEDFRYNLFVVESTGQPAAFNLTIRDHLGQVVGETSHQLLGYEQRIIQLDSNVLAADLENGTIELAVTGGSGRIVAIGAQVANGSQDGTTFEMAFAQSLLDAGVTSLNGLTGALTLEGDGSVSVSQSGSTITIRGDLNPTRAGAGLDSFFSAGDTTLFIEPAGVVSSMIADGAVTDEKIDTVSYSKIVGAPPASPPSGPAGGSLTGTYPDPALALNSVNTGQIVDSAVTDAKIASVAYAKVVGAPSSLPPSGAAGGSLAGSYPNPTLALNSVNTGQIVDGAVTPAKVNVAGALSGQAIVFNGASAVWGNAAATSLILPFAGSVGSASPAFSVTNTAGGSAIHAETTGNGSALTVDAGVSAGTAVRITNAGTAGGLAVSLTNAAGGARAIDIAHSGVGPGLFSSAASGNAVWGVTGSISAAGVIGDNASGEAVVGRCCSSAAPGYNANGIGAVVGRNDGPNGPGVRGFCTDTNCIGVLGQAGVAGSTGNAGRFQNLNAANPEPVVLISGNGAGAALQANGDVNITGTMTAAVKLFRIDHPLDPANKYLNHSVIESNEMVNIYSGTVETGADGRAVVEMPEWFSALNTNFRYQLTAIGGAAPNLHIASKLAGNRFEIAGAPGRLEVSWQVTGVRHDAFAREHRIDVEQEKEAENRGRYLHPRELGRSETEAIGFEATVSASEIAVEPRASQR